MMFFHIDVLFFLFISFLCNAMNNADQQYLALPNQNIDQSELTCAVTFPTDNMVVKINHDSLSTFCAKTGKQIIYIPRENCFINFCLSKNGKIAIIDGRELHVYCLKTGEILYSEKVDSDSKSVAFFTDNETVVVFDKYGRFITTYTNEQMKMKNFASRMTVTEPIHFTPHPIKDEFFITNYGVDRSKYHAIITVDKKAIDVNTVITRLIGNNDATLDAGVYNPNGKVIAINDKHKGYQFYSVECYDYFLTINSNKAQYSPYRAIAFHPQKAFAALANRDDNSIEFWDYTKKTEKPLAIISLKKTGKISVNHLLSKSIAFSPRGDKFVVISRYDNNCCIIPTPEAAYYDEDTKAHCAFINWAMKNSATITIPYDITTLIVKSLSRLPDVHLITQKIDQQKRKKQGGASCIIS